MAKKMMDKLKARIGIEQKGAKNAPASSPKKDPPTDGAEGVARGEAAQRPEKKAPAAEPQKLLGWWPEIYDDTDVCRVLGWRKRKLGEYRELPWTRGEDWDVVDGHVGMTGKFLREYTGLDVDEAWQRWSEENGLKRIEPADGIWTVRMVRRNPNLQMATVEVIATGEQKPCRVRDSQRIEIGQVFDCRMEGGRLVMKESLNTEAW